MANERPRVLLVDPDPEHRSQVTTVLAIAGYHVVEIPSGRMLLAAIARRPLDHDDLPVVVVGGGIVDEPDVSRTFKAVARAGVAPPVVSLPRGRLAARRLTAGVHHVIESGSSANELVHTVDHAFASIPTYALPAA
jgi:CheY-like chemotaxis protein